MPYTRVWIHYVWATKNREPVLTDNYRTPLFDHIRQNAKLKNIFLDRINGYHEHVHCLVSLGSDQTVEKVVQLLKGESAFWFNNKAGFINRKLEWQDEYFAVSISQSGIDGIRTYIDNQVAHHQHLTFAEEYEAFMTKYDFRKENRN